MVLNKRQQRIITLFPKPPLMWLIEPDFYGERRIKE